MIFRSFFSSGFIFHFFIFFLFSIEFVLFLTCCFTHKWFITGRADFYITNSVKYKTALFTGINHNKNLHLVLVYCSERNARTVICLSSYHIYIDISNHFFLILQTSYYLLFYLVVRHKAESRCSKYAILLRFIFIALAAVWRQTRIYLSSSFQQYLFK